MSKNYFIASTVLLSISFASLAANEVAIVDAGSTGSRISIYQYHSTNEGKLPTLTLEYSNKVKPGLESFAKDPAGVANYMKTLIGDHNQNKAEFYLMGTAGMRMLSQDAQNTIYTAVKNYLNANTQFDVKTIATIPGKWEGAFDWIAANYWQQTLFSDNSVGVLDMGGGSVEIAYKAYAPSADTVSFNLAGQPFTVYSRSDLGLGLNSAIGQYLNDANCFPVNYLLPDAQKGSGHSALCRDDSLSLTNTVHHVNLPALNIPAHMPFVAISGYYYTAKALGQTGTFTEQSLHQAAAGFCATTWGELKKLHPNDAYLQGYCFNASLIDGLLTRGYNFSATKQFESTNSIGGHDLNWTTGAILYHLENK